MRVPGHFPLIGPFEIRYFQRNFYFYGSVRFIYYYVYVLEHTSIFSISFKL